MVADAAVPVVVILSMDVIRDGARDGRELGTGCYRRYPPPRRILVQQIAESHAWIDDDLSESGLKACTAFIRVVRMMQPPSFRAASP